MKSLMAKAIAFYVSHTTLVRTFGAVLAAIIVVNTPLLNALLGFLIVGQIPGASRTIPYWMMMVGYVAVITAVITYFIETHFRQKKISATKLSANRRSRRRYSHG